MPVTTKPSQPLLEATARREHAACLLCGGEPPAGFHLHFMVQPDGAVEAAYLPERARQGYGGLLHGGAIAALLDAAMTNALFARGVAALTARLEVRYRRPVRLGLPVKVRGWLVDVRPPVYRLAAELRQDRGRAVQASAVFMQAGN
jgi:uncharacterized protein (TIGR00369 family)